jgi:sulfate adenylyltransferase
MQDSRSATHPTRDNDSPSQGQLITPYGGKLIDLICPDGQREELKALGSRLPSVQLSDRSVCDLEMLACGAFSPLDRFMGQEDYKRVIHEQRIRSGYIWPIPITLPIEPSPDLTLDKEIALRDSKNDLLAILRVEEIYQWEPKEIIAQVLGTEDVRHPLVTEIHRWPKCNVSGRLQILQLPMHFDFRDLRMTPSETRSRLDQFARANVIAFQTRNPFHRVHEEITKRAIARLDGVLLLHPAVGMTKPGDVNVHARVRTYTAVVRRYYDPQRVLLGLVPLAMWMAGPREALWHAIIRRNYGTNFIIIGRDHASPGEDSRGQPFYDPYEAQRLVEKHSADVGVGVVPFEEYVYLPDEDRYEERSKVSSGVRTMMISGTQVREGYLGTHQSLPEWFTRPEVAEILRETYPPLDKQGLCVWFTGLSCSGKSTTAEVLTSLLQERGRQVTLLDGDTVRTHLSKGLGFSKEDRDINIRRIGFVASEIVRHGGLVVCAAVSPYRATRNDVRNMVGRKHFVEIFVDTPLDVCEKRDAKGMYMKARRGEIKGFTGIDDPYEPPESPDIILKTSATTPLENARIVVDFIMQQGFVRERVN